MRFLEFELDFLKLFREFIVTHMVTIMKENPDFRKLYERLKSFAENSANVRLLNTLQNYGRDPEKICRKMNVISIQDINRISRNT